MRCTALFLMMARSSAVDDAIRREASLGRLLVERYKSELERFEDTYDMPTETFRARFEDGDLGDDEAFFEWLAVAKSLEHWEEKLSDLQAAG